MPRKNYDGFDDLTVNSSPLKSNPTIDLYNYLLSVEDKLPLKSLAKSGVIASPELSSLVALYSVSGIKDSGNFFKKATDSNSIHADVWSKVVLKEVMIKEISNKWCDFNVEKIDVRLITRLKELSITAEGIKSVSEVLQSIGVILVYVPTVNSAKIDGMVGRTNTGRPYIAMTLRHNRLDNFWFSLLHEIGHLKYHFLLLDSPIVENLDEVSTNDMEIEANKFALTAFIPRRLWSRTSLKFGLQNNEKLFEVSNELGVHPSIVAGRLRRDKQDYRLYSDVISEFDTRTILFEGNK
ncbi:ImmA/IrrE family metallo-endopeptidase [uncultured Shewanella sp.]|uniref:ImmA/IrrE family metallo-endopeptidase n=1 Tax=uncultured Shewanella sp. TaxID=173975 RepID=UPI003703E804